MAISIDRKAIRFEPDSSRIIARFFLSRRSRRCRAGRRRRRFHVAVAGERDARNGASNVLEPAPKHLRGVREQLLISIIGPHRAWSGGEGSQSRDAVPSGRYSDQAERVKRHVYDKKVFAEKLREMNIQKDIVSEIMDRLGDTFIYGELRASIDKTLEEKEISYSRSTRSPS